MGVFLFILEVGEMLGSGSGCESFILSVRN